MSFDRFFFIWAVGSFNCAWDRPLRVQLGEAIRANCRFSRPAGGMDELALTRSEPWCKRHCY